MLRVVKFETRYPVGKDPVDWVLVAPVGEAYQKTQTWHRVGKIDPANFPEEKRVGESYQDAQAKWSVIGPLYEAWKAGNEMPETGTPLEAWAGVNEQQVKVLRSLDVRTVEDVRDMGENTIARVRFPNARQLPKLAGDFLEGADAAAKDVKIAELEERMAAMSEMLEAQAAPKKRGRPPKVTEAA